MASGRWVLAAAVIGSGMALAGAVATVILIGGKEPTKKPEEPDDEPGDTQPAPSAV
jgi:hypothetical protein